jgi:ABC-type transport system involved in cytochrome c biogenesis permease subunit
VAPETALYYTANLALFAAVLLRWWNVCRPARIPDRVLRSTLILFVTLQGVALVWSVARSGPPSIAHPWLATMLMLEATILLCMLLERKPVPRAAGAIVITLAFFIHSYGLVIGPLPLWEDLTISPFARNPWYMLHVLGALVACGAYVCAAGGTTVYVAAMLPRRDDPVARGALQRDAKAFTRRTLTFAFPWLAGSVFAHAVWTYLAWGTYWSWRLAGVVLVIVWLILVATLHTRSRSRWQGTICALLTIFGLALALASLPLLGQGLVATW